MESAAEPTTPKRRTAKKKTGADTPAEKKSETGQGRPKRGKGKPKATKEEVEEAAAGSEDAEEY